MTVSEANATNEIAREVIALAQGGAVITPALEHGILILLINANKRLMAGYSHDTFFRDMENARKRAQSLAKGGRKDS